MDIYNIKEQEYFKMTEEERYESARRCLKLMKEDSNIMGDVMDEVIEEILLNELEFAKELENYMMCEAINNMLKIIKNAETL